MQFIQEYYMAIVRLEFASHSIMVMKCLMNGDTGGDRMEVMILLLQIIVQLDYLGEILLSKYFT